MPNSFTYDDYDFNTLNVIIRAGGIPMLGAPFEMSPTRLSRANGAVAAPSTFGVKTFPLKLFMEVGSGGMAAMLAAIDTFMLKANRVEDKQLVFDMLSDRYWNARPVGRPQVQNVGQEGATIDLTFQANDPLAYAVSESSSADAVSASGYATPDTVAYAILGSAVTYPTLSFAPSSSTGRIVLVNEALDETLTWDSTGADIVSGDLLKVECAPSAQYVSLKRSAVDSYSSEMAGVEGRFQSFTPGQTNTLTFYGFVGTVTVTWRNRYL